MKAQIKVNSETIDVEVKLNPLWWQKRGLSYTASGYGKKIPTQYMVKYLGRWMRVYCCIYSNIGTLYIVVKSVDIVVDIDTTEGKAE